MFWGFLPVSQYININVSSSNEQKVRDALYELYTRSQSAKALLDELITKNQTINLSEGLITSAITGNPALVRINFNDLNEFYILQDGSIGSCPLEGFLIHELSHAIRVTSDPVLPGNFVDPNYDHMGSALDFERIVIKELAQNGHASINANDVRVTYSTQVSSLDQLIHSGTGVSLTEDKIVGVVVSTSNRYNLSVADLSLWTEDALIIDKNNYTDVFLGGHGNDYIYAGNDNDTLYGGNGNNLLHGGFFGQTVTTDGEDTADYYSHTMPNAITIEMGKTAAFIGAPSSTKNGILVSYNGHGGTDRLFSIEKILLSYRDDTVIITDVNISNYELTGGNIFFDGKAGNDTLDLSNANGFVLIAADNSPLGSSASITFDSFEKIIGAKNHGNIIDARNSTVDEGVEITGGDKDDTIYGSSKSDKLTGGLGKDELHGGTGKDEYYVGVGDTIIDPDQQDGKVWLGTYEGSGNIQIEKLGRIKKAPAEIEALAGGADTKIYKQGDIFAWKEGGDLKLLKIKKNDKGGIDASSITDDNVITIKDWNNEKLGITLDETIKMVFLEIEPIYELGVTVGAKMILVQRTYVAAANGELVEDLGKAKGIWVSGANISSGMQVEINEDYVLNRPGSHFLRPGTFIDITNLVNWETLMQSAKNIMTNSLDRGTYHYYFDHPELGTAGNKKPYPFVNWNSFTQTLLHNEGIDITNIGLDWSKLMPLFGAGPLGAIAQSSTLLATNRLGENWYEVRAGDNWQHGLNLVGGAVTFDFFYGTKYTDLYFGAQPEWKGMWGDRVIFSGDPESDKGLTLKFTAFNMNDYMKGPSYKEGVSLGVQGVNEDLNAYDYLMAIDEIELTKNDDTVIVSFGLLDYLNINAITNDKRFTFLFRGNSAEGDGDTIDFSNLSNSIDYNSNDFVLKFTGLKNIYLELRELENFIATDKGDIVTIQNNALGITVVGGKGADRIITGAGKDFLYAGERSEDGNSSIDDGVADHLEGGAGFDTYYINKGDTIYDSDGNGKVIVDGFDLSGKWD